MILRVAKLSGVALTALLLGACASGGTSGGGTPGDASSTDRAVIELAVSNACIAAATAPCVTVNGESITLPPVFEEADVQDATVVEGNGQDSVQVTFTEEGAKVLNTITTQASEAGNGARLVMRAGGRMIGAPVALAPLEGREVSIAVSQDDSAQDLVDAILGR